MAMSDDFFQKSIRGWQACHAERNHQLPLQSEWPKQLRLRLSSHVWSLWQGLEEGSLAGALGWREPEWRRKARAWWWKCHLEGADERLKDFFFPDIDMQTYLGELAGYCTTVFGLQKEVEETYRQFLCRVHQTMQPWGVG